MRKINFSAGPACLPESVLGRLAEQVVEYQNTGLSILELGHRSPHFYAIIEQAKDRLKRLLRLPDGYGICLMPGGATLQFANVPLNFLTQGKTAAYLDTGVWASRAIAEAEKIGPVEIAASSAPAGYCRLPELDEIKLSENAAYLHVTSNNTIYGTQFKEFPKALAPLICDMSSDILSRPIPVEQFGLIYAGLQKNLGPAGASLIIAQQELLKTGRRSLPLIQDYRLMIKKNSLVNTPPIFQASALNEMLAWTEEQGGVEQLATRNEEKARMLYGVIDALPNFYRSTVERKVRSAMNAPFHLPNDELERKFLEQAAARNLIGLKGHRLVGGVRVSMYNALLPEELGALCDFMEEFARTHS